MSRTKRAKRFALMILLLACIFGAAILALLAWKELAPQVEADTMWKQMRTEREIPKTDQWEQLKMQYPTLVGWLSASDQGLDHPVMQGTDNTYYLTHLPDGTYNAVGSLFLDCDSDAKLQDDMTVLYGHYVGGNQMLSVLVQYAKPGYWQEHPTLRYLNAQGDYTLSVFAARETQPDERAALLAYNGMSAAEKVEWLAELMRHSDVEGITPATDSKLMALVTCKSGQEDAPRYIVFAEVKENT